MSEADSTAGTDPLRSITREVRPLTLGMAVTSVHFLNDSAVFVGAEESVILVDSECATTRREVLSGAILCAASEGERMVMGGDDGRVVVLDAEGEVSVLAVDARRRWIDAVALNSAGAIAWSAGKTAFVRDEQGTEKALDVPSTVGALALAPRGLRLAIAHYNGVTLWFPNMAGTEEFLPWAGSHLGVTFSPDNKFLVSAMHEPVLHAWRLADNAHMGLGGYPGRVKSMSWNGNGRFLATAGADVVVVWPFMSREGPLDCQPMVFAPLAARVTQVACHPEVDVLVAGYSDGTVLMVRLEDGAEILVRRKGDCAIAAVGWNASGTRLAFSDENGNAGLLKFKGG
ncbi:MAG: WD40 repeat domain-containing protein [Alphaproteobacteria bacterium]|nr:WD40 repeat domain-containing protein [Alphaproteobacteria bacterium]